MARTPRAMERVIAFCAMAGVLITLTGNILVGERSPLGEAVYLLGYFTIWTNLAVAVLYGVGHRAAFLRGGMTVMIVMVGLVYHLLLSGGHDPDGPLGHIGNLLCHYIVPAAVALDWIVYGPRRGLLWRWASVWLVFPLVYTVFAVIRGGLTGVYAYPFLDVATLGWAGLAREMAVLLVAFTLMGLIVIGAGKGLGRPNRTGAARQSSTP